MKQRFSSLDLQIVTHELSQSLLNHRLSNLYDLTTRIFLLKFARGPSKHLLVIDSGFRVHLTQFTRETSPTPSAFTQRLRKYLRTRRVTDISQLGVDRILRIQFSDGLYSLYLEFFAGGNVILTDADGTIVAVLRIVPAADGVQECRVGAVYAPSGKQGAGTITRERIVEVLTDAVDAAREPLLPEERPAATAGGKKFQRKKKKVDSALKRVLGARLSEFSPVLIEHALLGAGADPALKAADVLASEELLAKVVEAFGEAEKIVRELTTGEGSSRGYIVAKKPQDVKDEPKEEVEEVAEEKKMVSFGSTEATESTRAQEVQMEGVAKGLVFDDFHPFLPRQFVGVPGLTTLEYEGFNKTVDTFFSSIEAQKLESRLREREVAAVKRLEAARTDHKKRVDGLRDVQDLNVRKAQALEANAMRVEEATAAVNGLVNQGMDWVQIARLIESEQKRGNAVAELIQLPLKLYDNRITLKLRESSGEDEADERKFVGFSDDEDETDEEGEDEDDSKKPQPLSIDVDLALTAYANARTYYDQKRTAAEKETKTLQSSAKALKSTERKITADLKKGLKNEKQLLRPVRTPLWFEKFLFFISSDGYLVLGGRDAQQNDIIYKRYFKRGDVYVHADIQGAATIFVKNNPATPDAPIPPSTLQQAGTLSVSMSQAWDSKAVMSGWWVGFDQIAKMAPSGEYLSAGIFHVKGSKNFLPPAQLILGYGVLWRVDEESKKKHVRHRVEEPSETKAEQPEQQEEKDASDNGGKEELPGVKTGDVSDGGEFPDVKRDSEIEDEPEDEWFPDIQPNYGSDVEEDIHGDEDQEPAKDDDYKEQDQPEYEDAPVKLEDMTLEDFLTPRKAPVKAKEAKPEIERTEREGAPSPSPAPTPHLSAKQRRDLKKGKLISTPASASSQEPSRSSTPSQGPKSSTKPLPRGKKTKAKRAAAKYSLQDEDDRELALSLLGVAPKTTETSAAKEEAPKETPEQRKARLREQHQRAQAVGLAEEARRHQQGADEAECDEEENIDTPLDSLVPDPYADDVILDAIPVCAPWGAMGRYKYRVKLQPGAQKKGKAIREVLHGWIGDKGRMRGKEKELVTGWKETEAIACVGVGKVKVFGEAGKGGGGGDKGKAKAKGNPARGAAKKSAKK